MAAAKQMGLFRRGHILNILSAYSKLPTKPLDSHIRSYFHQRKTADLRETREVADIVYDMVRHKLYLETAAQKSQWEEMLKVYIDPEFRTKQRTSGLPTHLKFSFPEPFVEIMRNVYGRKTEMLLSALNHRPPLTIRVNTFKTSCAQLLQKWRTEDHLGVRKCSSSLYGLQIISRGAVNLFAMEDFKQGKFEVQDEASQLCSFQVPATPHMSILDFCAGSGGKSLAIAPLMQNKGQLYLHDIRPALLLEAKKRLKRAGVQNAQITTDLKRLKGKMDIVVVDVPCSGTGTLRRNPDLKWKFSLEGLKELILKQFSIVEEAQTYLKPGGELVYTTCSILPQENLEIVQRIEEKLNFKLVAEPFHTSPLLNDMDGFFTARLTRK